MIRYRERKIPANTFTDGQLFRLPIERADGDWHTSAGHHNGAAAVAYVDSGDRGEAAPCYEVQCAGDYLVIAMVPISITRIRVQDTLEVDLDAWAEEFGLESATGRELADDVRRYFHDFIVQLMPEHLRTVVRARGDEWQREL